jgi:hypothetical protein
MTAGYVTTLLRDVLYNASIHSGSSRTYAKGVIVGVTTTLMANGYSWEAAFELVKANLPNDCLEGVIPESWDV